MNLTEFFVAAEELINSTRSLLVAAEDQLAQAEDELIRKDRQVRPGPLPEDSAGLGVRSLAGQMVEVMLAYDLMLKVVDMAPWFELYFRLLDAPRPVREEVSRILERKGSS